MNGKSGSRASRSGATVARPLLSASRMGRSGNNTQATSAKTERNRRRRQRRNEINRQNREMAGEFSNTYLGVSGTPNSTRSGISPNPADPRTTVKQLGRTPNGSTWALKALHPNGEHVNFVPKIPDGAVSESVVLERRDEFDIVKPTQITEPTWSVVGVQFPVLRNSLIWIAGTDEALTVDSVNAAISLATSSSGAAANNGVWPAWQAVTTTPPVYYTKCQMTVMDSGIALTAGDTIDLFEGYFRSIRRTFCGITIDFDANDLTNKGRVTSGQFQAIMDQRAAQFSTGTDPVVINAIDVYNYDYPPVVNAQIVQEDSKCRQAEAKTGEYVPMRIWQPVIPLVPASAAKPLLRRGGTDGTATTDVLPTIQKNIWFDGWGLYVTRWESMDQSSSLRIKRKEGLEMVTGANSLYGPFSAPGYCDDGLAMSIVREFSRVEPHAYESDYNSKDYMSRGIFGSLGNILGGLGIPIVDQLGPILGGVLDNLLPI